MTTSRPLLTFNASMLQKNKKKGNIYKVQKRCKTRQFEMSFALRDFESVVRHIYWVSTLYISNYQAGIYSFHTVYTYVNRRRLDVFILFFFLKYLQTRKHFDEKVFLKLFPWRANDWKQQNFWGRGFWEQRDEATTIYDFLIIQSVIQSGKD